MMVLAPADEAELVDTLHTALRGRRARRHPLPARLRQRRRAARRAASPGRRAALRSAATAPTSRCSRSGAWSRRAEAAAELLAGAGRLGERRQPALGQAARLRDRLVGRADASAGRHRRGEHRDGRIRRGGVRGAGRPWTATPRAAAGHSGLLRHARCDAQAALRRRADRRRASQLRCSVGSSDIPPRAR